MIRTVILLWLSVGLWDWAKWFKPRLVEYDKAAANIAESYRQIRRRNNRTVADFALLLTFCIYLIFWPAKFFFHEDKL